MGAKVFQYTVILHRDPDYQGYWAEVPALPGCVSQGKTREEALNNIKEAIELHVEAMREDGEDVPVEESTKVVVEL
ncbi:MAG: type II toxin-antitoxin system HicB family antitoxin [Chloroflexi bacterium]|nr:type II toxin-antitoxin system HicB family antitoxin [Chloroflexota bacterium]